MKDRLKRFLQRLDIAIGTWLCRKFPNFAKRAGLLTEQGFSAGTDFSADLQIKVIRGNQNEKEKPDSQIRATGPFWNRMGKKR